MFPGEDDYETWQNKWWEGEELKVLCRALLVKKEAELPTVTHEIRETIDALGAALSQHYKAIGKPLAGKTPEEILAGYVKPTGPDAKHLVSAFDTKPQKTELDFSFAEDIEIVGSRERTKH